MRKLRVGVWVTEDYRPEEGGGYGYYSQIINKLYDYSFKDAEVIFISYKFSKKWDKKDKSYEIKTPPYKNPLSLFEKIIKKTYAKFFIKYYNSFFYVKKTTQEIKIQSELHKVVDVIYYPISGCHIENFPYIYTLWDVGHLSMYAFPEVSLNRIYEHRKQHLDKIPQKALMIFCESETGKNQAIKYLNLNENRVKVAPIFPSEIVSDKIVAKKINNLLDEDLFFIHYPAQFWSHKNHYNLLLAFKKVLEDYPNLKLIFTGSDKGNKTYILSLIEELNLKEKVLDLGFVSMEELKWIYKNSQGLVMPTFLGPTNMPLLEAAELGCRVACTDLEGHREQLGDYAYYFDPHNPKEIKEQIVLMLKDKNVSKLYDSKFTVENTLIRMDGYFSELKSIRFCWG